MNSRGIPLIPFDIGLVALRSGLREETDMTQNTSSKDFEHTSEYKLMIMIGNHKMPGRQFDIDLAALGNSLGKGICRTEKIWNKELRQISEHKSIRVTNNPQRLLIPIRKDSLVLRMRVRKEIHTI
jgi:hypothetical protein